MKVGDLVKMKGPERSWRWRVECKPGIGVILKAPHRTERTMRGCTIFWIQAQKTFELPEDWLEVVSEA